ALDRATARLAQHLRDYPEINMADVAFTLQTGRAKFNHRRILACREADDAAQALDTPDPKRMFSHHQLHERPSVVFMFPGGGAQYPHMGQELYEQEPVYRREIDLCLALMEPELQ